MVLVIQASLEEPEAECATGGTKKKPLVGIQLIREPVVEYPADTST